MLVLLYNFWVLEMTLQPSRRLLLQSVATGSALFATGGASGAGAADIRPLQPGALRAEDLPRHFDVEPGFHNLEAGYWSMMPRVVAEAYAGYNAAVNSANAIWARNVLPGGEGWSAAHKAAQGAVARQMGCAPEEIAITRSGADALQMLITNYKPLKAGDAVIHCDLDYDVMIAAMGWLGSHRGARVVKFAMPEPATTANILAAYEDVLKRTPDARLLLVTQVSNRTGLVTPVREIVAMARARGVDTIVDAAHGVALLDFQLDDLGADFVGWSVHKWTSAPLGTGAMYIRKSRLADIGIAFGNTLPETDINARVPAGTVNFPAVQTIPTAVDFHFAVGGAAKETHMRGLRDRWVNAVRDVSGVEICVPDDPARYCAITSFRLQGMASAEDARRVQRVLFERYRIHTVWRTGIAKGPVIRVTPGLYSTPADVDALAVALRVEHKMLS